MNTSKPPVVVAVVEDDAPPRTALGRLLQATGFEPVLFESAEAHIDAAPTPTCIVVDVQHPGMSGIELQQRLRAASSMLPIIVTTSRREDVSGSARNRTGAPCSSGSPSTAIRWLPPSRRSLIGRPNGS